MDLLTGALTGHFAAVTPLGPPAAGTGATYLSRAQAFYTLFWRLNESGGASGFNEGQSGTLDFSADAASQAALEYANATLAQDDSGGRCLGMGPSVGVTVLTRATNAAFDVAAGGFGCLVQVDHTASKQSVINRDDGLGGAGRFGLEILAGGAVTAWRRRGDDSALSTVTTPAGAVQVGVPLWLWLDWGAAGLRLVIDGALVANEASVWTNWATTTASSLRVGRWRTGVDGFDGLIGWIGFRNTQPSEAAIANSGLAAVQGVSLLTGTTLASVEDNSSATFHIRDYGHFTSAITSVNEGSHGANISVSVSGEDFTVNGLNVDASETLNLSVTDGRGTTPSAQFTIAVTGEAPSGEYITTPEAHGWASGNTVEANSDALRTAVANAAANAGSSSSGRGVVQFIQGKTYTVRPNGDANGTGSTYAPCIDVPSNVELRTQGTPNIGGAQARLLMESYASKSGPFYKRCMIRLNNSNNVVVRSLILDGNKNTFTNADLTNGTIDFHFGGNGGFHGIALRGCTNVTIQHVESMYNYTDGFSVNESETGTIQQIDNVLVEDCWSHHNGRQGLNHVSSRMTTPAYDNIIFRRCEFYSQGDSGGLYGQVPGAGIDLEQDSGGDRIDGVTFDSCVFRDNLGASYRSAGDSSEYVGLQGGAGFKLDCRDGSESYYVKLLDCEAYGNHDEGLGFVLREDAIISNLRVENMVCTDNGRSNGIRFSCASGTTGHYLSCVFKNNQAGQYYVNPILPASGHTVTLDQDGQGVPISNTGSRSAFTNIP